MRVCRLSPGVPQGIPRGLLSVDDAVGLVQRDAQQSRAWPVPLAFLAFAVVAERSGLVRSAADALRRSTRSVDGR